MNLIELERSLRQLRLGGMAAVLETRLRQAQVDAMPPIDLLSCLVSDLHKSATRQHCDPTWQDFEAALSCVTVDTVPFWSV